jgi:oligoribonuclease
MEKLFWVDMEMTGLDPQKEVIIEVAAIIADLDFKEYATYETVIRQPQKYIDGMDEWNRTHHGQSGLIAKIPNGKDQNTVESELIKLLQEHFPDPKARPVLAGNSIHQDRRFIDLHMPKLASVLHYRMLDVSSWKIVMKGKYGREFEKGKNHRALDDIRESINELKFYCEQIKIS